MNSPLEKAISGILGLAALAIAVVQVHREFFPRSNQRTHSEYVANWRSLLSSARIVGNQNAPITVIEFTDLQCPFCRRFNSALIAAREKFPGAVSTAFIHFPLTGHSHALTAARAVECALHFGKFEEAVDFTFAQQDSLGKKPWSWFANGAGISDTTGFAHCMADTASGQFIRAGLALGKKIDVAGTPTVLLNGWRYNGAPSDTELVRAVGDLLEGRTPYRGFPKSAVPSRPIASR